MKTTGIKRNDPCPCGSGKKFSHCCLGKENSTASGQGAAGMSELLRKALEGQQFNSLEEAQAFVSRHAQEQNRRPRDEFHGLSPEQMHRILNLPFASPGLVRFPEVLDTIPTAPILTLLGLLLDTIGDQGLKPTAKGNLPRNFCREAALAYWDEQRYQEQTRYGGINREEDFVEQFNWAYWDGYPELRLIQHAFLFTLYLLMRYGDVSRSQLFYEEAFLCAFPILLDEVPSSQPFSPDETVRHTYTGRSLVHFAGFLGLAMVEPVSDELLCREYRVKALPLLSQTVQFKFSR